jgi:heme O synthase-like polyprenyltransferase
MLANDDHEGRRTSLHALCYAVATLLLMFYPVVMGVAATWFLVPGLLISGWLCLLAWRFRIQRDRPSARKLFFCTLAYLPLILIFTSLAWKPTP